MTIPEHKETASLDLEDLFLQYGGVHHTRINPNQKIRYLTLLQDAFKNLGYSSTAVYKQKIDRKFTHFAVMGEPEKADYILLTYYDTPVCSPWNKGYEPFNDKRQEKVNSWNTLLQLTAFTFILFLLIFGWAKPAYAAGVNASSVFSSLVILLVMLLMMHVSRYGGFGKRSNLVRNSSSIVGLLKLASLLNEGEKKQTAFLFVDGGCSDYLGYYAASRLLKKSHGQVILCDCLGAFPCHFARQQSELLEQGFHHPLYFYGDYQGEGGQVDIEAVDQAVNQLYEKVSKEGGH